MQQGIGKKRNPGFHNRPIGMIFAREPKSKVWNQLDVSRTQIFQHFFFFFCLQKSMRCFPANFDQYSQLKANNAYFDQILAHK